jgi:hypothetical protein
VRDDLRSRGGWALYGVGALTVALIAICGWAIWNPSGDISIAFLTAHLGLLIAGGIAFIAVAIGVWTQFKVMKLREVVAGISEDLNERGRSRQGSLKKNGIDIGAEVAIHRGEVLQLRAEVDRLKIEVNAWDKWRKAHWLEHQGQSESDAELRGGARAIPQFVSGQERKAGSKVSDASTQVLFPGKGDPVQRLEPIGSGSGTEAGLTSVPIVSHSLQEGLAGQNAFRQMPEAQVSAPTPAVPPPPMVYFASVPEEDGSFKELKEREEYDALYKLTLEGPPATATTAMVDLCKNPDSFKAAIQLPSRYLSPVCIYDANPAKGASGIEQDRSGRAERTGPGQRWKIRENEKLRIRFW